MQHNVTFIRFRKSCDSMHYDITLHSCCPVDSSSNGWREKHFEQANKTTCELIVSLVFYFFWFGLIGFGVYCWFLLYPDVFLSPIDALRPSHVSSRFVSLRFVPCQVYVLVYLILKSDLGLKQALHELHKLLILSINIYVSPSVYCKCFLGYIRCIVSYVVCIAVNCNFLAPKNVVQIEFIAKKRWTKNESSLFYMWLLSVWPLFLFLLFIRCAKMTQRKCTALCNFFLFLLEQF